MKESSTKTPYHHGDLPSALRAATAELVAERGPSGFSLREVARRAGVSHAAPAHHFGDSKGLLTAVAADGFGQLNTAFAAAGEGVDDPIERLNAMGKAYVRTAFDFPGHFGVMCSGDLIDHDNETFSHNAERAYETLLQAIRDVRDAVNPNLDVDAAATLTWSMVHGFAVLSLGADNKVDGIEHLDHRIDQFTQLLINGYAAR